MFNQEKNVKKSKHTTEQSVIFRKDDGKNK